MREHTAVILCGGRGQRLGSLGDQLPKALIEVRGRPILWYIVARLYLEGFRHFILPLGYRGDQIQGFIDRNLTEWDVRIDAIPTGESTEVGLRLQRVRHLLPQTSFLLINGDTLFDFPVASVMAEHEASGMAVTLMSCPVVSQFGLLVMDGDKVIDFTRDSLVRSFQVLDPNGTGALHRAYVNSGIALRGRPPSTLSILPAQRILNPSFTASSSPKDKRVITPSRATGSPSTPRRMWKSPMRSGWTIRARRERSI